VGTPFARQLGVLAPPFTFTGSILANATPENDNRQRHRKRREHDERHAKDEKLTS
jgi:hypothetical protein